jgi:hypothetical protein
LKHQGSSGTNETVWTYTYVVVTYTALSVPTVVTSDASDVAVTSATFNGNNTDDGGSTIDNYGFVWDTVTHAANPGNVAPGASGYSNNWTIGAGSYAEGVFSHATGAILSSDTVYYYRACSHNNEGWAYGDEENFETIGTPTIDTTAASNIGSYTARLNSLVTDDNGQACDVRFGYGAAAHANVGDYDTVTAWVTDTYETGNKPYVDISSLALGTTYHFKVEIRNDAGSSMGSDLTFTTLVTLDPPEYFVGVPSSTSISLQWVKGSGTDRTLVRRKTGSYPVSVTDGTLVYFDDKSSVSDTGLTEGTSYYYMAWSESSGFYSSNNATILVTTLAPEAGETDIDSPDMPAEWYQSPDYTTMSGFFMYGLINWGADCFGMPYATIWFLIAITISVLMGIIGYNLSKGNGLLVSGLTVAFFLTVFTLMKLVSMWILLPYYIILATAIIVGERR